MKPVRIISFWSPILINDRYVSLSGQDQFGDHWFSTTIVELDVETRTARTISGRSYRLHGEPDPEYALSQALRLLRQNYDLDGSTVEAISLEAADAWLRKQPEKPSLSEKDSARGEARRRRQVWGWLRWHAMESGMTDIHLAGVTELPLHVIENLHKGVDGLGEVTTDEVEEGLGRLRDRRSRLVPEEAFGSGNVFRDLGFEDWEERTEKADLVLRIASRAYDVEIAIEELAASFDLNAAALAGGDTDDISIDRLREVAEAVEALVTNPGRKP